MRNLSKRVRSVGAIALTFALVAGIAACNPSNSTPSDSKDTASGDKTTSQDSSNDSNLSTDANAHAEIIMLTAPVGMHPLKTNDAPSTDLTVQMFETLYRRTIDGTTYEPLLAEALPEFSEDGKTATIKLRKDVKFQDGTPFTSKAVGYMIDCLQDEAYGSLRPSIVESIESYELPDDNTIKLKLAYEDGVLVAKLAHTNGAIVNPELDKTKDLLVDPVGAGTGPYVLKNAVTGSTYELEANKDYWGGEPQVKTAKISVVTDESSALARLQTGEADLLPTLSVNNFETAGQIDGYVTENHPSSAIYFLANRSHEETAKNPLMKDENFRKALFMALDMPGFTESMMGDKASYTASIVGPTLVGYSEKMEETGYKFDRDAAKAIIDENGWAGQTVTLSTATRPWHRDLSLYVQSQLQEIGLTVEILSEEWASFLSTRDQAHKFDMIILSWSNVTGDGHQMLDPNFTTKNGKAVQYNNEAFDALVDQAAKTTDAEARTQALLDAVTLIQNEAVAAPVYSANQLYCYNANKFSKLELDTSATYRIVEFELK